MPRMSEDSHQYSSSPAVDVTLHTNRYHTAIPEKLVDQLRQM